MKGEYIDTLQTSDPLYHYFQNEILSILAKPRSETTWSVFRMSGSKEVYLYEDEQRGTRFVGKFFYDGESDSDRDRAAIWMRREYDNLCLLRAYGFSSYPHFVIRPLSYNTLLNNILVEEYFAGESLGDIINAALYAGRGERLLYKLTALAYFLAALHNRTALDYSVHPGPEYLYMEECLQLLMENNRITSARSGDFRRFITLWAQDGKMWEDCQVLVHGDATPGNFLFGDGLCVMAIDLERMRYADRVYDVGRVAGELIHYFMRAKGCSDEAETCIGHFLRTYSSHFPDRTAAFLSITGRLPFYMTLTLLRIARNSWLDDDYRVRLLEKAFLIIRSIL